MVLKNVKFCIVDNLNDIFFGEYMNEVLEEDDGGYYNIVEVNIVICFEDL